MLIKTPTPDTNLTFQPPLPPVFRAPLPPSAISPPRGKMTRRKRVRMRKKYNQLRRLARINKVHLVIHSFFHGTFVLNQEENNNE
jgi:hypothetical protein